MKNFNKAIGIFAISALSFTMTAHAEDVINSADTLNACLQTENAICTLTGNIDITSAIAVTKSATIDLAGHDITLTNSDGSAYVITFDAAGGKFVLKDSKNTGSIKNTNGRGVLVSDGNLTLNGVKVISNDRALQVYSTGTSKKASATLESGRLETTKASSSRTVFLAGNNTEAESATFIMEGGEVVAPISAKNSAGINVGNQASGGTKAVLKGGTVTAYNGVRLYGNGNEGMTVFTMENGTVNAVGSGVIMSNNNDAKNVEVYLYGGTIKAADQDGQATVNGDAVAVNQSQTGKLVIGKEDGTGPTLIGETGVAIKEGDITIQGGDIKATGTYRAHPTKNDDGTEDTGAAVSITSTSADSNISVKITGGNITSENGNALYEGIAEGRTEVTESKVSDFAITGGEFTSAEGKDSVVAENYAESFISGGTYSTPVSKYFDDEKVGQSVSGQVGDVHKINAVADNGTVTVNENAVAGETVTVSATAKDGYQLTSIVITDKDGKEVTLTDGKFTMPASDVTVTATFAAIKTDDTVTEAPKTLDAIVGYAALALASLGLVGVSVKKYLRKN